MPKYCNEGRNGISLAGAKEHFYAIPADVKVHGFVTKKFFVNVSISRGSCHDWIPSHDGINVLMFNFKTVNVMNIEPNTITKYLWLNWSHNRSVIKCISFNQMKTK